MSSDRENFEHNRATERHHAKMMAVVDGLPQDNPLGIMALLEVEISRAMNDCATAQVHFQSCHKALDFIREVDLKHHKAMIDGLQKTNAEIDDLQTKLDDYIPDGVFPDYIIIPSADAYDESAAQVFFNHIFDLYEGEEGYFALQELILLQNRLRETYKKREEWLELDKKQSDIREHKAVSTAVNRYKEAEMVLAKAHAKLVFLLSQRTGAQDKVDPATIRAEGRIRVQSGNEAKAFNDAAAMLQSLGKETKEREAQIEAAQTVAQETIQDTEGFAQNIIQKTAQSNAAVEKALRDPLLSVNYRRSVRQQIDKQLANAPRDRNNYDRALRVLGERWPDFKEQRRTVYINPNRNKHVKVNLALRGGFLVEGNQLSIIPLIRDNENGNTVLCMIPDHDNAIVTLGININSQRKWHIMTVFNQYPEWTAEEENETQGVPAGVTDNEDEKPENCLEYHKLVLERLKPRIDERLAQANITDMMGITMNDPATSVVFE